MILDNILNTLTSVATKAYGELDRVYLIDFGSILESSKDPFIFVTSLVTNVLTEVLGNKGSSAGYITSLASQITTTLMNQVFDLDVKMWWYRFRINPSTASITRRKLQNVTEYGYGVYDLESFGDSFTNMSFSGTTGLLYPPKELASMGVRDVRLSAPYLKLATLERFYKQTTQRLLLTLYGRVYMGYLDDLSWTVDANNPYKIDYTFTFMAHPYFVFDIFTMDFNILNTHNHIIWDNLARPTQAMGLSNYGDMFEFATKIF